MKKHKIAIIIGLAVIVILCGMYFTGRNQHNYGAQISDYGSPKSVKPSTTKAAEPSKTRFSEEVRAKARKDFLAECTSKLGSQQSSVCVCSADYLGAHYSDLELAQMYLKFHSTKTVTAEMQAAYDACEKK